MDLGPKIFPQEKILLVPKQDVILVTKTYGNRNRNADAPTYLKKLANALDIKIESGHWGGMHNTDSILRYYIDFICDEKQCRLIDKSGNSSLSSLKGHFVLENIFCELNVIPEDNTITISLPQEQLQITAKESIEKYRKTIDNIFYTLAKGLGN